jgi:thiol-disulfide isomerase/thioredoxin
MTDGSAPPTRSRRSPLVISAVLAGVAIGYVGYTKIEESQRAARLAASPCAPAVATARRVAPLIRGEVAALTAASTPLEIPNLSFEDAQGATRTLADFRGKTILLNLWATWCVPCRKEMPALNALQKQQGGADFEVVAVNIDTRDGEKPKAFFAEEKLDALGYFTDKSARVFQDLKTVARATGMPTSILIDAKGCEIATLAGPAEWHSTDAQALVSAVKAKDVR